MCKLKYIFFSKSDGSKKDIIFSLTYRHTGERIIVFCIRLNKNNLLVSLKYFNKMATNNEVAEA